MKESSSKVRIALAMEHPLLQQGGIEVLVRELIRRLAGRFEIVLVSRDQNREETGDHFASLITKHFFWDSGAHSRQAARELASALTAYQVKLVHFHGGTYEWEGHKAWQSPIFYLTAAGVPCLVTNHLVSPLLSGYSNSNRPDWQKVLLLPKAWLSKALLLSRVQAEVLVSKHDYKQLRRCFPPLAGKLRQMYHSKLARESRGLPMDRREKAVLCLGTICEHKGQTILIRAFASVAHRHPEWTLHLVGRCETADYLEEVRAIADRAGLSKRVLISPPQIDPGLFLETASIFAMPSLREPLGLSLQEALYYECACVGSAVGGIPELIEHETTGLLAPPGDEKALSAALDRLMSDPELRKRLARQARQSILDKGMLAETMVENYVRLYEAILAGEKLHDI
jgi:glycosyltransferase involved in cell wall biosynthesis